MLPKLAGARSVALTARMVRVEPVTVQVEPAMVPADRMAAAVMRVIDHTARLALMGRLDRMVHRVPTVRRARMAAAAIMLVR